MIVKCLAQEHNTMARPGLERAPLDPECGSIKTRVHRAFLDFKPDREISPFVGLFNTGIASIYSVPGVREYKCCARHRDKKLRTHFHLQVLPGCKLVYTHPPKMFKCKKSRQ